LTYKIIVPLEEENERKESLIIREVGIEAAYFSFQEILLKVLLVAYTEAST
jgi:hypothetical protein